MRKLRKPLSWLLTVCMLFSLLPGTALAADPTAIKADNNTLTSWQDVFDVDGNLSTKDIGRIWTDKTVSESDITLTGTIEGQPGQNQIQKEVDADFLVGLSALGSAATIEDSSTVPTDTVIVLDMSPRMKDNAEDMVSAANDAMFTLLQANPDNRVAVVAYDNTAATILDLAHYVNQRDNSLLTYSTSGWDNNGTVTGNGVLTTGGTGSGGRFEFDNGTNKNTQAGIYYAMQILNTAADIEVNGIKRRPVVILLSEGEAKIGDTHFVAPPAIKADGTPNIGTATMSRYRHAQTFAAILTAAYMKQQVTEHYFGASPSPEEKAYIYTIGIDVAGAQNEDLARICLDFSNNKDTELGQTFLGYLNEYNTTGSVAVQYRQLITDPTVTFRQSDNSGVTISEAAFSYNDAYYDLEDGADWDEIFNQILDDLATTLPSSPTKTEDEGAAGTGGESGKLVFTDQLGPYMKLVGTPVLVYADQQYRATDNLDGTYTFSGTVNVNEIYPNANLQDIVLKVTTSGNTQTLTWEIPASLLPLRSVKASTHTDAYGTTTHAIEEVRNAYPIRLFYSVDRDDAVQFGASDNNYFIANSKNGTTNFYSNAWDAAAAGDDQYGTTTAVFTPAESNDFYYYTKSTPLYVLSQNNRPLTLEAAKAAGLSVIEGDTPVGSITYTLIPATTYDSSYAYFYEHEYYQGTGTGTGAEKKMDYHLVLDSADLAGRYETGADSQMYIQAGNRKMSRVEDTAAAKTVNSSETSKFYRAPVYSLSGTDTVTVHLGNNGLRTEDTPTGTLTVNVATTTGNGANPDQTFTFTLGLYNADQNGTTSPLTGSYTLKTTADQSGTSIQNRGTFTLKAGQEATISGLPAGAAYQITETSPATYTPAYTNGDANYANHPYGRILYTAAGGDPSATLTVTYNFDPTSSSFTLTYNANALQNGTPGNVPGQQTVQGGDVTLSSQTPTLTLPSGEAVVFVGWTKTATTQIYKLGDTLPTERYESGGTCPITADTDLYAVWGYDTDGDGTPDVNETSRTVIYNANGGYFGDPASNITSKTETVPQQPSYSLKTEGEFKPSRSDKKDNKALAFIGWSLTEDNTVYDLSTYSPTVITSTVDLSTGNQEVFAVWGYDTDGDGTPDVYEQTLSIDASAGDHGSISPSGHVLVPESNDQKFEFQPDAGYAVDTVTIDQTAHVNNGENAALNGTDWSSYTFPSVTTQHTIHVTFAEVTGGGTVPDKYNRTLTYYGNGGYFGTENVTEKEETGLNDGARHPLKSTGEYKPEHVKQDGHDVLFIGWTETNNHETVYKRGDGGSLPDLCGNTVTISGDMEVYAVWGLDADDDGEPDVTENDHHITATAGPNGSISPSEAYVANGNDAAFTITPSTNYAVDTITIDSTNYVNNGTTSAPGDSWTSYTFSNVTADHTIAVTFGEDKNGNGVPDDNETIKTYEVTATVEGGNGSIDPESATVNAGADVDFTITANEGYALDTIKVNNSTVYTNDDPDAPFTDSDDREGTWKLKNVQEVTTVVVTFGLDEDGNGVPDDNETTKTYEVTATVEGGNGSIDPTSKTVNAGEDVEFTITAEGGYALDTIQVNDKTEYTNTPDDPFQMGDDLSGTWTLKNVQEATTVVVAFGEDKDGNGIPDDNEEPEETQYTVTASSDNEEQGSIDPTEATVDAGDDLPFTIHAEDGCALDYITVNGDVVYANNDPEDAFGGIWTLKDIRADSDVVAYFGEDTDGDGVPDEPSYWTIEASAGSGGGIDPEGEVFVADGEDQRFTFDPDRDYEIDRVRVDGASERVRSSYTFEEVTGNHTIRVTFAEVEEDDGDDDDDDDDGGITYLTITATAGEGGSISPDGRVQVAYNRNKSFIIQADEGYELADVLVDGRSVGAVGRYTFEKVHKNHTITAVFAASQDLKGVDRWLNTRDHIAYLSGYPDGTFGPDRNMTRAEVAQMFYALLNDQNVPTTVSFSDVPDGAWYADAVETLASLGMFTGYPDGTFHPNSTITRAEFAAVALSFADMASNARCSFPDVSAQDWFYPYVACATEYGWFGGYPDGTFRPNGSITRAEVAVIVNHMLGRTPDQSFVDRSLDRLVSFSDLTRGHWAFYPIMEATNSHDHSTAGGSEEWTGIRS